MKICERNINEEPKTLETAFDRVWKNKKAFVDLPEEIRQSKSLVLRILDAKIDIIEELGIELKKDKDIILKSLQKFSILRNDSLYISQAILVDPLFFHFAGPEIAKCDQVYFMNLIKQQPTITIFANLDIEQCPNYKAGKLKAEALMAPKISPSLTQWHAKTRLKKVNK